MLSDRKLFWVIMAFLGIMFIRNETRMDRLEDQIDTLNAIIQTKESVKYTQNDLECLTKNIYWEAATEPFEGKVAVAQVTMNRVDTGRFGKDVCGVVYKRDNILGTIVCQFSWACTNVTKVKPVYPGLWKESEEVAKKVLLENFRLPSMKEALYYHADYINPGWRREKVAKIGHHIFYK